MITAVAVTAAVPALVAGSTPALAATPTPPVTASPASTPSPTSSAAVNPLAAAPVQLEDNNGGSALCMNRNGNGGSIGTSVIAYNCGYANNDFQFDNSLYDMCGGGKVTQTCPFTYGSGLNAAYAGWQIGTLDAYDESLCVGGGSPTDFDAKLEPCPPPNGVGGGYSTVDVFRASRTSGGKTFYIVVNRNWSDRLYAGGSCYGVACSLVVSDIRGYVDPLELSVGDSNIQSGKFSAAGNSEVWAELLS